MSNRVKSLLLWVLAVILMMSAASYQRRTGPTYELKGQFLVAGVTYDYELLRSSNTTDGALISIPVPDHEVTAVVGYRRYPTDDAFGELALRAEGGRLVGRLPVQPAAGKLEYFVELTAAGDAPIRLPDSADTVILRYKDPVPVGVLLPHVLVMFLSMLIGVRAAFAAVFGVGPARALAWTTFGGITLGGMILGPIVQKYAFGAYWTGFPFGYDLTDNKTLIMWLAWALACGIVGLRSAAETSPSRQGRVAIVGAALVTVVVYLIPHSFRGSELDYEAGEVKTGLIAEPARCFDNWPSDRDFVVPCRRGRLGRALSRDLQRIPT